VRGQVTVIRRRFIDWFLPKSRRGPHIFRRAKGTGKGRQRPSRVQIESLEVRTLLAGTDFGDAPTAAQAGSGTFTTDYPVTLAEDGARHLAVGLRLGSNRDGESDGAHTANADADDTTGSPDDEDGVTFPYPLYSGGVDNSFGVVNIDLQNAGDPDYEYNYIDAWIDFNHDGDWLDRADFREPRDSRRR